MGLKWEEKKRLNQDLERRSRMAVAIKPEFAKPGDKVRMPSGSKYVVRPDGSWRRIRE